MWEGIGCGRHGATCGCVVVVMTLNLNGTDKSKYKNLVDALDEMQICSIGKYVIDKINPDDEKLLKEKGVE